MIKRKYMQVAVGIAISLIFLYLFFKRTDFRELGETLKHARYWWLLPGSLVNLSAIFLRSIRWRFFFPPGKKTHLYHLWSATVIGFMANCLLPARMGEVVRAWVYSRKESVPVSTSFATIVTERIFDFLSILILFLVFFGFFLPSETNMEGQESFFQWVYRAAWIMGAISIGAFLFLVALRLRKERVERLIMFLLTPLPGRMRIRISGILNSFFEGLSILDNVRRLILVFFLSFCIWLIFSVNTFFIFKALEIDAGLHVALFIVIIVAFAVSIPSAPGYIGTYHLAAQRSLQFWLTESPETLSAFALLAHAVSFIPITIVGLIFLWLGNISFREISSAGDSKPVVERG